MSHSHTGSAAESPLEVFQNNLTLQSSKTLLPSWDVYSVWHSVRSRNWGWEGWIQRGLSNLAAHKHPLSLFHPSTHSFPPFPRELPEDGYVGQFLSLPGQATVEDGEEMSAWQSPTGNVKGQNLPKNTKKSLLTVASAPILRLFLLRRFLQIVFVWRNLREVKCPLLPLSAFVGHLE